MALVPGGQTWCLQLKIVFLPLCLVAIMAEERRECREQEYKDHYGNCIACKQCDAGQELSKECGFGYGEDAECVPCRAGRFKEDSSLQKCKPCLHCTLLNRFQKANCSSMKNAVCGDCLPGFYRKTKLSGFQDMECIPCGDPPPPYEPHCSGRVNLVPIPSTVSSPRDVALAAVICSALATVLLALFILCVIYCRRQLLEKKPASLRTPEGPFSGEELSCLDRRQVLDFSQPPCCHRPHAAGPTCGPVLLIPSMCCEDRCSQGRRHAREHERGPFQPQGRLNERHVASSLGSSQDDMGKNAPAEFFEVWQLMADTEDRCDPQPHLCSPQPTENNSLEEEEEEEEEEDDCSGLLHTEGVSAVPLNRDSVLVSQHVSVVEAPVCP